MTTLSDNVYRQQTNSKLSEINPKIPSAVPTLKVMRLQAPELFQSSNSLILPDSFGVIHIGETFTAYLGALNTSTNTHVTNLSVNASLQTLTRRFPLSSSLEDIDGKKSICIPPSSGMDAIVSRSLEEVGQHILRVEVSYGSNPSAKRAGLSYDGNGNAIDGLSGSSHGQNPANPNPRKTLRKFYRFAVSSPLHIRELTRRSSESSCVLSLAVENSSGAAVSANGNSSSFGNGGFTISQAEFQPFPGLLANRIHHASAPKPTAKKSSVELFDECGSLESGSSHRYLFSVRTKAKDGIVRGICGGDELGKAVVTWRKTMGEAGRIASTFVVCPPSDATMQDNKRNTPRRGEQAEDENHPFVVHGSGLSVDVASSAANRSTSHAPSEIPNILPLDELYPVTGEYVVIIDGDTHAKNHFVAQTNRG